MTISRSCCVRWDWCEIRNGAYDQWREALAVAAGTTRQRVLVSSLHQHDAPVTDRDAAKLLKSVGLVGELYDEVFHDDAVARVAAALAASLDDAKQITHLGMGQAKVARIASNRRVVMPDGRVAFSRGSRSGANQFHSSAPEGEIDPFLKTISFWQNDQPLLALHAYATHPMSYYGAGEVTSDFVGLARDRRQRDDFSVKQIYVSGCSGDVTAGKYNDGSPDSRLALTQRLYDGMVAAWSNTRRVPLEKISFRNTQFELEFHPKPSLTETTLSDVLADPTKTVETRILAAMGIGQPSAGRPWPADRHALYRFWGGEDSTVSWRVVCGLPADGTEDVPRYICPLGGLWRMLARVHSDRIGVPGFVSR